MHDSRRGDKRGSWRRVSVAEPCPICDSSDFCTVTADGRLARCMRVEAGAFRTATDKNGQAYYLHRLGGEAPRPPADPGARVRPAGNRAGPDVLHGVYDALLGGLPLSAAHREQLRRRGLPDSEIDRRLYRSLPVHGRAAKARHLGDRFGAEVLLSVPGFARRPGKDGRHYLTIIGAAGLLVPVRDLAGRIAAVKVRRDDDAGGGPRYSYLSSSKHGGPGPGTPLHIPQGVTAPCLHVRLTEGELKADTAYLLSGTPTISSPGVAGWPAAIPILRQLETKTVLIAFDADAAANPQVAHALAACVEGLTAEGFAVLVERWSTVDGRPKGIDDALAQGAAVEALEGDAAGAFVALALATATAGEPLPPPGPLDRLDAVLAEGGAEALYGDNELLEALARLAEADPAAFAARRARLKLAGVSVRDLDRALGGRRAAVRAELPPRVLQAGYRVAGGRLVRESLTPQGAVEVPLANFTARIVAETTRDDGAERSVSLSIEGQLCDGQPLPRVEVPADGFAGLDWILPAWGTRAVVYAGRGTADHLRVAIQLHSGGAAARTVYGHLGWRRLGEQWVYLHAGGAIGQDGPVDGVEVAPPDALARYVLPAPLAVVSLRAGLAFGELGRAARQEVNALADAVRASLSLLDFGPPHLSFPLLAAVYRAVLGGTDFTVHLTGQSGVYKSEIAALMQQHFGAEMVRRHLPASWSSTGNSLEALTFAAKDALLTVDDFAPSGSAADVGRLHREAERLLRAQGNTAGRMRMRADGALRPAKPPRGLILSTGEDVPRGQSVRARLLVMDVERGDIDAAKLTAAQRDAAAGRYAEALAGFVRWLAPHYDAVRERLAAERAELRERAADDGQHARTPGIVADLALGFRYLLDFAAEAGAIDAAQRAALWERGWRALCEAGAAQAEHGRAADPVEQFARLLSAALASGRAHVAATDGGPPETPSASGWRREVGHDGPDWRPQGRRVGWIDAEALYLEPEASYAAAQGMAGEQGESLAVSSATMRRRLKERGILVSTAEKRQELTVRRTLEGSRRNVLHLQASLLVTKPAQPAHGDENAEEMGGFAGRVCGRVIDNPPTNPPTKTEENRSLGGLGGLDSGRDASRNGNNSAPYLAPGLSEDDVHTPFDDGD